MMCKTVVTDDTGVVVRLAQPARRIVSLAPHVTESLFAIGAGERIVATVDYSDYPAAAQKLPRVGGYSRLDLEAIAAVKPDLIIGWASGNAPAHIDKLRALGFPTTMFTVLFALARTVGWIAQWNEMISDPGQKIGRPRQLYTGPTQRDYVPIEQR